MAAADAADTEGFPAMSASNSTADKKIGDTIETYTEDTGDMTFELVPCVVIPDSEEKASSGRNKHSGSAGGGRGMRGPRQRTWKHSRPRQGSADRRDVGDTRNTTETEDNKSGDGMDGPSQSELTPSDYSTVDEATATALVLEQLEHYFSVKNLCRDVFMRSYMDCEGWVPLPFVADFNCIRTVCTDLDLVRVCASTSEVLEYNEEHDKVRLKSGWKQWLFPNPQNDGYGLPLWLKTQGQEQPANDPAGGGTVPGSISPASRDSTDVQKKSDAAKNIGKLRFRASAEPYVPKN